MYELDVVKQEPLRYVEEPDDSKLVYEEDSGDSDSQVLQAEEDQPESKPKILIQRLFHQPDKHMVEQKLDYVIANSKAEITKHIYGGLFRSKYYKYCPDNYCKKHAPDLFEHEDETLVKIGDKFASLECFRLYIDGNAQRWKYYLKCADSHRKNGKDTFVFQCVFAKKRHKGPQSKGIRKRTFAVPRCECPCRVMLKPVPFDAKDLTVIYVCNHHDHPLNDEFFHKLQHGRRLHPRIKNEIMDLLSLDVGVEVAKKYFQSLTGYCMSYAFFKNLMITMKKKNIERQFSLEKLKQMTEKIKKIKEELGIEYGEEDNVDNDLAFDETISEDRKSQAVEALNVVQKVIATKKTIQKRERQVAPAQVDSRSRLEAALQELKHDREMLQSIKHLQESVRGDPARNNWATEDVAPKCCPTLIKSKRGRNPQKQSPISTPTIKDEIVVFEHPQIDMTNVENQEIMYENEITVVETTVETSPEEGVIENCIQIVDPNDINLNENVTYCIQYEDGDQMGNDQEYVLMLEDSENLENVSEVCIESTEFAAIGINSENNQNHFTEVESTVDIADAQTENSEVQATEIPIKFSETIRVVGESPDLSKIEDAMVCELIETDDKKLWPSKELVDNLILKKPPKPVRKRVFNETKLLKSSSKEDHLNMTDKRKCRVNLASKSEEYIKNMLQYNLEHLDDDECFMVVVNEEKQNDAESHFEWMEDFDDYDVQSKIGNPSEYAESVMSDNSKCNELRNERELKSEFIRNITLRDSEVEGAEKSFTIDERERKEKEKSELENSIKKLSQQKHALEKDIEDLIARKDDLIEDITRAGRVVRRINNR